MSKKSVGDLGEGITDDVFDNGLVNAVCSIP